jgi:enterochelin esterase-like enzyme
MGGREALVIGISMPDVFGFIGAFSPAPGLLSFEEMSFPGQLAASEMTLPDGYKDNTFIMINNGNQDGVVNDVPFQYHNALSDNGIRHAYYTIDGGHDFGVWKNGLYYFTKCIGLAGNTDK